MVEVIRVETPLLTPPPKQISLTHLPVRKMSSKPLPSRRRLVPTQVSSGKHRNSQSWSRGNKNNTSTGYLLYTLPGIHMSA